MSFFNSLVPSFGRSPAVASESQRSSTPGIKPAYEIKETPEAFGLTVHLPGVTKDTLSFTVEEDVITVRGERAWKRPAGWFALYRESSDLPFELVLQHDHTIDPDKIHAELRDGVLKVSLPKTEAIKPRKITVS